MERFVKFFSELGGRRWEKEMEKNSQELPEGINKNRC
jgi:hypothetical protein